MMRTEEETSGIEENREKMRSAEALGSWWGVEEVGVKRGVEQKSKVDHRSLVELLRNVTYLSHFATQLTVFHGTQSA